MPKAALQAMRCDPTPTELGTRRGIPRLRHNNRVRAEYVFRLGEPKQVYIDGMEDIKDSAQRYDTWLGEQLGSDLVTSDVARKHEKMRSNPFAFLRATYWRWAETILSICPDLSSAPVVLSIGDTHLENFGTWRDAEGRLVWGTNDFDDAAIMPYPLDLVRLAASALLAPGGGSARNICSALWDGYLSGLAAPAPVILERDHRWLREAILLPEKERLKWWAKFDRPDLGIPGRFRTALADALPQPAMPFVAFARSAGTGSLGKPRLVAIADWRGGPVVRECKAILPSAWGVFATKRAALVQAGEIASAATRAVDPHYHVASGLIVRRLSPNSRKIEIADAGALLTSRDMLNLMGREIAACQAGDTARIGPVQIDALDRASHWLVDSARSAAAAVKRDFEAFV